jgi:pimeloyl-ACP methyl ester carboxylesterase
MTYTVAVLLPGTTGTQLLKKTLGVQTVIWPDAVVAAAKANPNNPQLALSLLEAQDLYPGTPLKWGTKDGYGSFAQYFRNLGFSVASASASSPTPPASLTGNLLIGFGYDWRQDNTTSAQALQTLLNNIDARYGNAYQLYLIGHSMGGLVSRAYLETSLANAKVTQKIKGLITLGTPHLGAPLALGGVMGMLQDLPSEAAFLDTLIPSFLDQSWSDSTYELLPPNQTAMCPQTAFLIDSTGSRYSVFDPKLPSYMLNAVTGLNASDLAKAGSFFSGLEYSPGQQSKLPPYYCLAGNCTSEPTCESFTYAGGKYTEGDDHSGDMIVPTWSALFTGRSVPVTAYQVTDAEVNHLQLPSNAEVQGQVAKWMGVSCADGAAETVERSGSHIPDESRPEEALTIA